MKKIFALSFLVCFSSLFSQNPVVQSNPIGIYFREGVSRGLNTSDAQIQQQFEGRYYQSTSFAFYASVPITKNESGKGIFQFFKFIRIDFFWDSKSGAFESANGSIARVNSFSYGTNIIAPFQFEIASEKHGYVGLGLNLGNAYRTEIIPSSLASEFEKKSNFVWGINLEVGFRLGKNSMIALRPLEETLGSFQYSGASLLFGFSPQPMKR